MRSGGFVTGVHPAATPPGRQGRCQGARSGHCRAGGWVPDPVSQALDGTSRRSVWVPSAVLQPASRSRQQGARIEALRSERQRRSEAGPSEACSPCRARPGHWAGATALALRTFATDLPAWPCGCGRVRRGVPPDPDVGCWVEARARRRGRPGLGAKPRLAHHGDAAAPSGWRQALGRFKVATAQEEQTRLMREIDEIARQLHELSQ